MKLIHICPACNKEHEVDSVPEPSQLCSNCKNFNAFIDLVKDQFKYGGQKYALNNERESTDVLFDKHGKNWLFGTVDKYTFRYKNLARERDLLKIACYMFITWLKRGFYIMDKGINDPAIDTNLETKNHNFPKFVEQANTYANIFEKTHYSTFYIEQISIILEKLSKSEWKDVNKYELFDIFYNAYKEWNKKYSNIEVHDTDTYSNKKNK